ncbi:MAG: conjugal transfer protein, partial [Mesorhizobium sp.]
LMNTVLGVSALVTGSQKAVTTRRSALEQAGQSIGQAQDIKGSIDQNTQLQVQAGLTINELIGVMNGAVGSLQADNQRRLTDISNSKKALTYGGN